MRHRVGPGPLTTAFNLEPVVGSLLPPFNSLTPFVYFRSLGNSVTRMLVQP